MKPLQRIDPTYAHGLLAQYAVMQMQPVDPLDGTRTSSRSRLTSSVRALEERKAIIEFCPWARTLTPRHLGNRYTTLRLPCGLWRKTLQTVAPLGVFVLQGPMQRVPKLYPLGIKSLMIEVITEILHHGYSVQPGCMPKDDQVFFCVVFPKPILPDNVHLTITDQRQLTYAFSTRALDHSLLLERMFESIGAADATIPMHGQGQGQGSV